MYSTVALHRNIAGVAGIEPTSTVLETGMLPLHQTPMVGMLLFSLSVVFPKLLYTNLGATQPRATEQNRTDISSIPRTCN